MLYFVSTPIGNLGDMTYRAVEVLSSVDVIACEDTRHSLPLLNKYDIKKPLISYQKFNEATVSQKIIETLKEGKTVAVISDAGTPVLSDPGSVLVKALIEADESFTVVPGANAVLPALILSGLDSSNFTFIGFLPEKNSDREKLLESYQNVPSTLIFYCAPHDVKKTSEALYKSLGSRKAVAVKEITKIYESRTEFVLGEVPEIDLRGEFVILVEGKTIGSDFSDLTIVEHVSLYLNSGMSKNDAIKKVAKDRGVNKNEVYKLFFNEEK